MAEERELLSLLVSLMVLIFMIADRRRLAGLPDHRLLFLAYAVLVAAWSCTVVEGFIFPDLLNVLQHALSAGSALILLVWCYRVLWRKQARARS